VEAAEPSVVAVIEATAAGLGLEVARPQPNLVSVSLPGTRKLRTECGWRVGSHSVTIVAFVARNPDENHERVYRWLLERNLKLYGVAFCIDALGDIYLTGRIGLERVTSSEVDRILGAVADAADSSFNTILETGFATSIRREWAWRRRRGESTANLAAFPQLDPRADG
jgi:hypothetical protein